MKSLKLLPALCFACISFIAKSQLPALVDTSIAEINTVDQTNKIKYTPVLRPLRGIAGAPQPYYSYLWEFGDGTYSFEKEPVHSYKDTGTYNVRLYATNNYDDGKKPRTKPKPIKVNASYNLATSNPKFFTGNGSIEMKANQMAKPGEDMVLLIGYKNDNALTKSGSIMLLYNEKQFKQNCFDIAEARSYNKERSISFDSLLAYAPAPFDVPELTEERKGLFNAGLGYERTPKQMQMIAYLKQQASTFKKQNIWRIENINRGEEKIMFVEMNTLPEMIKDTNAVVMLSALFIPDDSAYDIEKFDLEIQVVASHDPNKMQMKNRKMNYRFTGKNKDLTYKVRFQNTGKGPAKKVAVTVILPGMLNATTVDLIEMKPKCIWCDSAYPNQSCIDTIITKDSIQFIFNNIYLPGTLQESVTDPDSTMGFIKYKLNFGKMAKQAFTSSASIVFDKNPPIYTNRSVGKFKKGISPGIIIGYGNNVTSNKKIGNKSYLVGATLSEFHPQKKYIQWELYVHHYSTLNTLLNKRVDGDTVINGMPYKIESREVYARQTITSLEAVPIQLRYNFSRLFSAGAGLVVAGDIFTKTDTTLSATLSRFNATGTSAITLIDSRLNSKKQTFSEWRGGIFIDAQVGLVRVGPVIGARLYQYLNPSHSRFMLYAAWKF